MTDLSGYVFEALREGSEYVMYRGRSPGGDDPILVLAAIHPEQTPANLKRLEHEYALKDDLDPAWAARPRALTRHDGRTMLVLDDPGGTPLHRMLGHPMEVNRFLRIAIPLTTAIHRMHRHGLIHKHIKPSNVLVDAAGNVRLTGFGLASRLPRERRAPAPPDIVAGTFAYMAPEQTGRMNRSIDARSDLYSLGVTFYAMLTGTLPFIASDPAEWIYCHIARDPPSPAERASGIPPPLAAIVLKLLAKAAEDRYQTAAGLEADLKYCREAWEKQGRIEAFELGSRDTPHRLLVPERLYGREAEIGALAAAFDRVASTGTSELVLISGYSGIGKSSIVSELHKVLVPARGLFAVGKFDQVKRDIPYATLAQAFQGLVRQLLGLNDAELGRWRQALLEAVGSNGQLMVNLIPNLALIIGEQPAAPDAAADVLPQDAQNRFQRVVQRVLGVFARPEHPLVLFLDDLQWLDTATLELLRRLTIEPQVRHLLIVGAYRDNEVAPSHSLAQTMQAIREAGGRVRDITLGPLTRDDVVRVVADALHTNTDRVQALAALLVEKTGGNPFFVIAFVTALVEDGLLAFDPDAAIWRWDLDRIRTRGITDNVVVLMVEKVNRLPGRTLRLLKRLACLGNSTHASTLGITAEISEQGVHDALGEALRAELVTLRDGCYAFVHDRIQEAVYALIPEAERPAAHLRIGRRLAARGAPLRDEMIFEIVNQLDRGAALIETQQERDQVAALNLSAGRRARTSSAYASALGYFTTGRMLLGEDGWARDERLTFDLEFHCAECEFLTGELGRAEERLSALWERPASVIDKASVTRLRLMLNTTLDRNDHAIEVGLAYLRHVGVNWSRQPTDDDVRIEYERMRQLLGQRSPDQILDLPLMDNPDWRATMDVLADLMPPLLFVAGNLHDLVLLRMANISLKHGHCDASCYAYARLNQVLGYRFADYETAFRFGQVACDLVERRGLDRFKARVYMCFGIFVLPWSQHLPSARPWIARALDAANATGDPTFAAYTSKHLTTNMLLSGEPLPDVEREVERGLASARKAKFRLVTDAFVGELMMIRCLRGHPADVAAPDGDTQTPGGFEQHQEQPGYPALPACWYWIHRLQACFLAHDQAGALRAVAKAQSLLWSSRSFLETAEYHLYAALVHAAAVDSAPAEDRQHHLNALHDHHRQIVLWAKHCPANFETRAALVGAEIARIEGRDPDAERLYEDAIRSARAHGFIQNEGMAHELAGRFHAARGSHTMADNELRSARSCYLRWGADGKVNQLDLNHPHLRSDQAPLRHDSTMGTAVELLDLATVIKVSQAISGEIDLKALIDTLMTTALEHAGADRGVLILPQGDGRLQVEAEALSVGDVIRVHMRHAHVLPDELPESILRYVVRTQDSVLLGDASEKSPFSDDAYVAHNHSRSVLCLPLVKQASLIGILYLENRRTPHVFTPQRIAVLKLLASQAAMSLENARLYAELQQSDAYLAEAQRLSHTGSFGWNASRQELVWSAQTFQIYEFPPPVMPSLDEILTRVHPDDVGLVRRFIDDGPHDADWELEHRLMMPDGRTKSIHVVAHAVRDEAGAMQFIGAVMDVTASKRADEALHKAQAALAHVSRVTTLGELAASIAHEVNQPLSAIVANGEASLRWLDRPQPEIDEVRNAMEQMIDDAQRAGDVIHRIRSLSKKIQPEQVLLDINDVIRDVIKLVDREIMSHQISLQVDLTDGLPPVLGDRVQLQQVIINLVINGIQAMAEVDRHARTLSIRSDRFPPDQVLVSVQDSGAGIDPENAHRLFDAFYTTKPSGMGMGLSICRSIIEVHGGRIWASSQEGAGALFQFALPAHSRRLS